MIFTTALALGGSAAPAFWLVVARFSGLAALLLAFLVTRRLGGRRKALAATAALALARDFLYNCARGDSEGLLVALALGAILAHLGGRRRLAFGLAATAALLRPEIWFLVAAQDVWLIRVIPRPSTAFLVVGSGLAVVALWIVPELFGSGEALRAASRARNPVPGSPGQSAFPFLKTFAVASVMLPWPVYVAAAFRVRSAWRGRRRSGDDRVVLVIAAAASVLMMTVAALSELGFTGTCATSPCRRRASA